MEVNWSEYEGEVLEGHSLKTFLGVRDGKGFYSTSVGAKSTPALIQLLPAQASNAGSQADSWSRAAMLSHENLIHLYATGEGTLAETPVIYAAGQLPEDDLSEILPKRTLDQKEAKALLTSLAAALDFLHSNGLVHGAVAPAHVFAIGDNIKLGVDTLHPASGQTGQRGDLRQLGSTVMEVLTGKKDAALSEAPELDPSFRDALEGCLSADPSWTAKRVLQAVSSGRVAPVATWQPSRREPLSFEEGESQPPRKLWPWAAALVVIAAIGFVSLNRSAPVPKPPAHPPVAKETKGVETKVVEQRPSPVELPTTPLRTPPQGVRPGWAVIVATYGSHAGAEKRAKKVRQRWPEFPVHVAPDEGQGPRYFVLLGSGLPKSEAQSLQRRARGAGFPRDTYVTSFRP